MTPKKVRDYIAEYARRKQHAKKNNKNKGKGKKGRKGRKPKPLPKKAPTSLEIAKLLNRDDFFDWAEHVGFKLHYRPTAIDKKLAGRDNWEDYEVIRTATSQKLPHRRGYKPAVRTRKIKLGKLGLPSIILESLDYEDQESYVKTLMEMGFSERQAYSLWASP